MIKAWQNAQRGDRRAGPFTVTENLLSPEQQRLLMVRRAAEGRVAEERRLVVAAFVVIMTLLSTASAIWLYGLDPLNVLVSDLDWRKVGRSWIHPQSGEVTAQP